ncbi:hypothetical protein DXG01_006336 [Tephrocybe rancida]|nr:hypothetical protein DXG01_006336 [Tephrocybe rancida]
MPSCSLLSSQPPPPPPPPPPGPIVYHPLPFEILDMIFTRTVAPSFLLDSSIIAGPQSAWSRARQMKLSLISVSRSWYAAGITLIYKEVVIRRLNQIPGLLETLEASPLGLGVLVKQLSLDMFVPSGYATSFSRHIQRIADLCPNLEGLILSSPCPLPAKVTLPKLHPTLKDLRVGAACSSAEFFDLLQNTHENLTSLSIHVHEPPEMFLTTKVYHLPKLESLNIQIAYAGVESWTQLGQILDMPSLRRLRIELVSGANADEQAVLNWNSMTELFITFCSGFESLTFLDINPGFRRKSGDMRGILNTCPNLKHLVIYNGAELESHPTVKWVDVCTSKMFGEDDTAQYSHDSALSRIRKSLVPARFPALQGIRWMHICSPHLRDIAACIPPDAVASPADAFVWDFNGIRVRHDHGSMLTERQVDNRKMWEGYDLWTIRDEYEPRDDPDRARSDGTTSVASGSTKRKASEFDDSSSEYSSASSGRSVRLKTRHPTLPYGHD